MVEERVWLLAVLWRRDELPYEALDVLVSTVMQQTEDQDDPADGLHVFLPEAALTPSVAEDVPPAPPPGGTGERQ